MRELSIPFKEHLLPFGHALSWDAYRKISPNGKVPCLVDDGTTVWDSLAIVEYLAERHPGVWPADPAARAWARSAAAEMHSGFSDLRNHCSMSCGVLVRLTHFSPGLVQDVARVSALWGDGLQRFGGPFLAGRAFTAVDAFFAPVAFRVRSYSLALELPAAEYGGRLLALSGMQEWYAAALAETFRDQPHEEEMHRAGEVLEDLRAK
jgi:glutathione S-transferase